MRNAVKRRTGKPAFVFTFVNLNSCMKQYPYRLTDGSKVAIIGGGPAGSFFALYLLHFAWMKGIRPDITIYQDRSFDALGPKGCKGCAGIASPMLIKNLAKIGLTIPPEVIQSKINRFVVHSPYATLDISNPEKDLQIASFYRGGGPRFSHYEKNISFDGWLLRQAESRGARVENRTVSLIRIGSIAEIETEGERISCDLAVLATGVNAKPIPVEGVAYSPPETRIMVMSELFAGAAEVQNCLGNMAHAFLIPHSGVIFGTMVPKGDFINVSVLSNNKYPVSISDFLSYDIVKELLPPQYEFACRCRPCTPYGMSRNYYADRFLAIGDAAVIRLYKDGIGSSLMEARIAAYTAVYRSVSRRHFERYYSPFCRTMHRNNMWGRFLFFINDKTKGSRTFLQTQQRLIGNEHDKTDRQPFTQAAWGMFTGSYTYADIAQKIFNPLSFIRFVIAFFMEGMGNLFIKKKEKKPRRLYVGGRNVLILGGGFGGIYTLRHLVRRTNKDEKINITLISDENYFLFTPLLHEVAMGSIETRHIAYPIRRLHWRDRFTFIKASVEKIDIKKRHVITSNGTFDFDCIVLALGSITDKSQLNLEDGGYVFTLKTLFDAIFLRDHIIGVFERASIEKDPEKQRQLLTFIVAGGGYIGVQTASGLRDFILVNLLKYYKNIDPLQIRIILIEAGENIIYRLDPKLGDYIMAQLKNMGIEVRTMSRITRVWEGHAEINGQEIVPTESIIWTTGMISHPRIAEIDAEKDNLGRLIVNSHMEIPGMSGVYALGDCSHFEDAKSAQPLPPRAHTTVRQAKIVAHNIIADIRGVEKKPYHYTDMGEIVSVGNSKAVFRFFRLKLYGFPARLTWLTVYSALVTGHYNRIRIIADWLLSLIFGRDATLFNLEGK
jgi:NADH dehydrogenase